MDEYIATALALSYEAAALTVYAAPAPVAENARGGVPCARGCRVLDTSTRGRVHHSCAVSYVAAAVCAVAPPVVEYVMPAPYVSYVAPAPHAYVAPAP